MSNSNALTDRLPATGHLRAPLAAAGAAVLGLSMLLSVGPVLGAANDGNDNNPVAHGTSGNVKVHDAGTGVEAPGTDNEPHVCAFWLGFTLDAPFEAGTWVVVSWAPTGDGSTVASGVYDTGGDGLDSSSVIELVGGHYRVEWAATGATTSKKKTFWVDATCAETAPIDEEPAPPTDAPGSPAEESQAEDVTPPTDAPASESEESQPEDVTPPTDVPGSQSEESVLAGDGTRPEDKEPPAEEAPATDEEEPAAPVDEPALDPVEVEEPAQVEDAGATDPGSPPVQDELGNIGGAEEPTMSDTATPTVPAQSGWLAAIGLLMVISAHAAARRDRHADRENAVLHR